MENTYLDALQREYVTETPKQPERTSEEIKTSIMERINSLGAGNGFI